VGREGEGREEGHDRSDAVEWLEVIRGNGIVYVGLDALTDTTVASAIGNSMFADLVSVAGHLYKHGVAGEGAPRLPTVSLHADEFNELSGEEFVPPLSKAGGAGFQVTADTQTWFDVEARVGSRAKAGQVAGNFNTLVMLRVKGSRRCQWWRSPGWSTWRCPSASTRASSCCRSPGSSR
jgi:hypothetical protein